MVNAYKPLKFLKCVRNTYLVYLQQYPSVLKQATARFSDQSVIFMFALSLSVDIIFPMVTTCTKDDGEAVISSGLSVPHTLRDSGQGRVPRASPARRSAGQGRHDLFLAGGAFMNFSLHFSYCQVATHVIYVLVCPR